MKTVQECVREINSKLGDYAKIYDAYEMLDELYQFDESTGKFTEKSEPLDFWSVARESTVIGRLAVDAWVGPDRYTVKFTNGGLPWPYLGGIYCSTRDELASLLAAAFKRGNQNHLPYAVAVC